MLSLEEVRKLACQIKAVVLDVDGVLTPDTEFIFPGGVIAKARSHNDGQGVSLIRAIGLLVVFITSEADSSPGCDCIKQLVTKWNNLPSAQRLDDPWPMVGLYTGVDDQDKGQILLSWSGEAGIDPKDCLVMGDDLVDVPMLRLAGLKVAPANAESVVKQMADWITIRPGGAGAVRDLANFILEARGIDPLSLAVK